MVNHLPPKPLCFLCGSAGIEQLIFCYSCCEPYHPFCTGDESLVSAFVARSIIPKKSKSSKCISTIETETDMSELESQGTIPIYYPSLSPPSTPDQSNFPLHQLESDIETQKEHQLSTYFLNWTCSRCLECSICHNTSNSKSNTEFLKCTLCCLHFHKACTNTKKGSYSRSHQGTKWYCEACYKCTSCGKSVEDKINGRPIEPLIINNDLHCLTCFKQKQRGSYCPICLVCYSDNDFESRMMGCDQCNHWVHATCENITEEQYQILGGLPETVQYVCRLCDPSTKPFWIQAIDLEIRNGIEAIFRIFQKKAITSFRKKKKALQQQQEAEAQKAIIETKPKIVRNLFIFPKDLPPTTQLPSKIQELLNSKDVVLQECHVMLEDCCRKRNIPKVPVPEPEENICILKNNPNEEIPILSEDEVNESQLLTPKKGNGVQIPTTPSTPSKKINALLDNLIGQIDLENSSILTTYQLAMSSFEMEDTDEPEDISQLKEQFDSTVKEVFPWFNAEKLEDLKNKANQGNHQRNIRSLKMSGSGNLGLKLQSHTETILRNPFEDIFWTNRNQIDLRKCSFCHETGDFPPESSGRLLWAGLQDWVHVNCALWSSEVYEGDTGALQQVGTSLFRSKSLTCALCQESGASVACCASSCKKAYHFPCAVKGKCYLQEDKKLFCPEHRKKARENQQKDMQVMRKVYVETDWFRKREKPKNPKDLRIFIGSLRINRIGRIVPISVTDQIPEFIPLGFKGSRIFWSGNSTYGKMEYKFSTKLGSKKSKFSSNCETTTTNEINIVIDHSKPEPIIRKKWEQVIKFHNWYSNAPRYINEWEEEWIPPCPLPLGQMDGETESGSDVDADIEDNDDLDFEMLDVGVQTSLCSSKSTSPTIIRSIPIDSLSPLEVLQEEEEEDASSFDDYLLSSPVVEESLNSFVNEVWHDCLEFEEIFSDDANSIKKEFKLLQVDGANDDESESGTSSDDSFEESVRGSEIESSDEDSEITEEDDSSISTDSNTTNTTSESTNSSRSQTEDSKRKQTSKTGKLSKKAKSEMEKLDKKSSGSRRTSPKQKKKSPKATTTTTTEPLLIRKSVRGNSIVKGGRTLRSREKKPTLEIRTQEYKCPQCKKIFQSKISLNRHVRFCKPKKVKPETSEKKKSELEPEPGSSKVKNEGEGIVANKPKRGRPSNASRAAQNTEPDVPSTSASAPQQETKKKNPITPEIETIGSDQPVTCTRCKNTYRTGASYQKHLATCVEYSSSDEDSEDVEPESHPLPIPVVVLEPVPSPKLVNEKDTDSSDSESSESESTTSSSSTSTSQVEVTNCDLPTGNSSGSGQQQVDLEIMKLNIDEQHTTFVSEEQEDEMYGEDEIETEEQPEETLFEGGLDETETEYQQPQPQPQSQEIPVENMHAFYPNLPPHQQHQQIDVHLMNQLQQHQSLNPAMLNNPNNNYSIITMPQLPQNSWPPQQNPQSQSTAPYFHIPMPQPDQQQQNLPVNANANYAHNFQTPNQSHCQVPFQQHETFTAQLRSGQTIAIPRSLESQPQPPHHPIYQQQIQQHLQNQHNLNPVQPQPLAQNPIDQHQITLQQMHQAQQHFQHQQHHQMSDTMHVQHQQHPQTLNNPVAPMQLIVPSPTNPSNPDPNLQVELQRRLLQAQGAYFPHNNKAPYEVMQGNPINQPGHFVRVPLPHDQSQSPSHFHISAPPLPQSIQQEISMSPRVHLRPISSPKKLEQYQQLPQTQIQNQFYDPNSNQSGYHQQHPEPHHQSSSFLGSSSEQQQMGSACFQSQQQQQPLMVVQEQQRTSQQSPSYLLDPNSMNMSVANIQVPAPVPINPPQPRPVLSTTSKTKRKYTKQGQTKVRAEHQLQHGNLFRGRGLGAGRQGELLYQHMVGLKPTRSPLPKLLPATVGNGSSGAGAGAITTSSASATSLNATGIAPTSTSDSVLSPIVCTKSSITPNSNIAVVRPMEHPLQKMSAQISQIESNFSNTTVSHTQTLTPQPQVQNPQPVQDQPSHQNHFPHPRTLESDKIEPNVKSLPFPKPVMSEFKLVHVKDDHNEESREDKPQVFDAVASEGPPSVVETLAGATEVKAEEQENSTETQSITPTENVPAVEPEEPKIKNQSPEISAPAPTPTISSPGIYKLRLTSKPGLNSYCIDSFDGPSKDCPVVPMKTVKVKARIKTGENAGTSTEIVIRPVPHTIPIPDPDAGDENESNRTVAEEEETTTAIETIDLRPQQSGEINLKAPLTHRAVIVYEVNYNNRVHFRSGDVRAVWNYVLEKVQGVRLNHNLPPLSYPYYNLSLPGNKVDAAKAFEKTGLTHRAVQFLLEQLPPLQTAVRRQHVFKYHEPPKVSEEDTPVIANITGCARSEGYHGRKPFDMFGWLASKHRQPIAQAFVTKSETSKNTGLPAAMQFRNLNKQGLKHLNVFWSSIHGRGLFTTKDIESGDMIIEYAGEVIRSQVSDLREKYYESKGIGCYFFRIDENSVVDATMKGNAARFINHSCEPNCKSRMLEIHGQKHLLIFALRRIPSGEELTYDYKFPIEEVKIPCTCGTPRCRKFLN